MTIKHLVISGGGYKGFYSVGVINHLLENNFFDLNNIENIYGSSVGTIIGVVICLKLEWKDVIEYGINCPWHKKIQFNSKMILDAFTKKGCLGMDFFSEILSGLLHNAKLSKNITFKELYEYSKINLNMYTVNLTEYKLETLNHELTPDLEIIKGIHMSCCIPFIFQPVFFKNNLYCDGCVINPYPLNKCLEYHKDKKEILAIRIIDTKISPVTEESSIIYYGFYLLFKLVVENYKIKRSYNLKNEVIIPAVQINMTDAMSILTDTKTREKMIKEGERFATIFLYKNNKNFKDKMY